MEYLDVKLDVLGEDLHTSVFHKVDNFSFPVILFTFPDSQIPYKMGLCVFTGQVLRYLRICSHLSYVVDRVRRTKDILVERGYHNSDLSRHLSLTLKKHCFTLYKFGVFSCNEFVRLCGFNS